MEVFPAAEADEVVTDSVADRLDRPPLTEVRVAQ
jgi:hypothetical protein